MNTLQALPRNHHQWVSIADFLDAQFLASFGLTRVSDRAARQGPACGMAPREAQPVGNTGITYEAPKHV